MPWPADRPDRAPAGPALAEAVARAFGLGSVPAWRDLGGSRSTNLLLGPAGRRPVVGRVHRRSVAPERVAAEQAARRALADRGVPTVVPLADAAGATIHRLAGGYPAELEDHVPWTAGMKTPEQLRTGYAVLGAVHDGLRSAGLASAAHHAEEANALDAGAALAAAERGARRVRTWADPGLARFADAAVRHLDRVAAAEQAFAGDQRVQVVHGDFWDDNVLFRGDRLVAVLDFGFMAARARVDDLALPFWFFLLEPDRGPPTPDDADLLADLVRAYDSVAEAPLSEAERASLPLAVARQPAWSIGGWVVRMGEGDAVRHAREAAAELPVAEQVLDQLAAWQRALA